MHCINCRPEKCVMWGFFWGGGKVGEEQLFQLLDKLKISCDVVDYIRLLNVKELFR